MFWFAYIYVANAKYINKILNEFTITNSNYENYITLNIFNEVILLQKL